MDWLNYHHLLYFWTVAKEGSIARASQKLRLTHPTISAQIHRLEEALGEKLFERQGRRLVVTGFGRIVERYGDEIFALGSELMETAKGRPSGRPIRLVVGISDALAKSLVYEFLKPVFQLGHPVHVIGREDRSTEAFMGELASHAVDVVLADEPASPGAPVRLFSHLLGECGTAFFAAPKLAQVLKGRFPGSLRGAPCIFPGRNSRMYRLLAQWFDTVEVKPNIVAEFDDAALEKIVAEAGVGVFSAPDIVEQEVQRRYNVEVVGRAKNLRQRFYAISLERKIRHPAVVAITETARKDTFA